MSATFLRTARSLEADGFRSRAFGLLFAALLLAAWTLWLFLARVPVYALSDHARLEVDRAVHPVAAPVAGRLVATHLRLGATVAAGEVLAELDPGEQVAELDEQRTRLDALRPEMAAMEREIAAEEAAVSSSHQASAAELEEGRATLRDAEAAARQASEEAERGQRLRDEGQLAEVEFTRLRTEAERKKAAAESARLAVARRGQEGSAGQSDRRARIERLRGDLVHLQGQAATAQAAIDRLELDVDRRLIRAPAAGRLAEVGQFGPGSVVGEGDKLGAVVPEGKLRVVADFAPPVAVGRVRSGQAARLRLDGFAWTAYGTLPARVTEVASETRAGQVRVELAVLPEAGSSIPLQHGLPGTVEVEVERVSPAALLLRAAGKLVARPARTGPPAGEPAGTEKD